VWSDGIYSQCWQADINLFGLLSVLSGVRSITTYSWYVAMGDLPRRNVPSDILDGDITIMWWCTAVVGQILRVVAADTRHRCLAPCLPLAVHFHRLKMAVLISTIDV